MNKYNEGKIYKIINPDLPNIIYIGSTIQPLKTRFNCHKSDSKKFNKSSKILFSVGEPEIILLEAYPCECKRDLEMKEQKYINNIGCINKQKSFISDEEKKEYFKDWYQKNKEIINEKSKEYREKNKEILNEKAKKYYEKHKEYYQKNKEIINEKQKEKITCVCGSIIRKSNKSTHEKSKKHQAFINNKEST